MKKFTLLVFSLLATVTLSAQVSLPIIADMNDGLPGVEENRAYTMPYPKLFVWTSPVYNLQESVDGIRLTVFETCINELYNGFPMIAVSELEFYDGNGNKIGYSSMDVKTNSLEILEGHLSYLNDGNKESFYHSLWNANHQGEKPTDYVYLDVTFDSEVQDLQIVYAGRDSRHAPLMLGISKKGERVERPARGYCGKDITWSYNEGKLTVEGTGELSGYLSDYAAFSPWTHLLPEMKEVVISEGITGVSQYLARENVLNSTGLFENASELEKVTLPDGFIRIPNNMFSYCTNLAELNIPSTVIQIGERVFQYCDSLTEIILPEGIKAIGECAFQGCSSLTEMNIPESLTVLNGWLLNGCENLVTVNIPNTVQYIGRAAFQGCKNLVNVEIPDFATVEGFLFNFCSSLPEIKLPKNTTVIFENMFSGCDSLKKVVIPEGITDINNNAFAGCSSLESIQIPNTVTYIGEGAFANCISLQGIELPSGITSLGAYLFCGCTKLQGINIPENVTSIGDMAFGWCDSIKSITFPEGVESIGESVLRLCPMLESVYLPASLETIGMSFLYGCDNVKAVYSSGETPAVVADSTVFENVYDTATLYVPVGAKAAYEAADYWKDFFNIVELDFTGIDNIETDIITPNTFYDLNGRVVNQPTKGIYICNGKKVLF